MRIRAESLHLKTTSFTSFYFTSSTMFTMMKMWAGWRGLLFLSLCIVTSQFQIKEPEKKQHSDIIQGSDCTHIKSLFPTAKSGIYTIQPSGAKKPFQAYCEMLDDGGWTVIQKRTGKQVAFNRNWKAYKKGFGMLLKDHWLGLSKIWVLTKDKKKTSTLRVDLWDFDGGSAYAEYKNFRIGSERTAYKLHVGAYSGNAGDALRGAYAGIDQNGYGFSTHDRDNDGCSPCIFGDIATDTCSEGGGWWFSRCGSADLHGDWHPGDSNRGWASGLHWKTWKGPGPYSAKATRMMVKSI